MRPLEEHPWFLNCPDQEFDMPDHTGRPERTSGTELTPPPDPDDEPPVLKRAQEARASWGGSFWDSDEEASDEEAGDEEADDEEASDEEAGNEEAGNENKATTKRFETGLTFGDPQLITPAAAYFYPFFGACEV